MPTSPLFTETSSEDDTRVAIAKRLMMTLDDMTLDDTLPFTDIEFCETALNADVLADIDEDRLVSQYA
jgi:hypothetical protein